MQPRRHLLWPRSAGDVCRGYHWIRLHGVVLFVLRSSLTLLVLLPKFERLGGLAHGLYITRIVWRADNLALVFAQQLPLSQLRCPSERCILLLQVLLRPLMTEGSALSLVNELCGLHSSAHRWL